MTAEYPSSYVDATKLLNAPRQSRTDMIYQQLREDVPQLAWVPHVLLRIIAEYAPPRLLLFFGGYPFPVCYAISPSAAIHAGKPLTITICTSTNHSCCSLQCHQQ